MTTKFSSDKTTGVRFGDSLFYLSSGAAQVWSALMVFHILLIRDLKNHVEHEIDTLWAEARVLWPKLLASLKSPEGLRAKLPSFGLTTDTILRADTHKNSFIRLIAAIKAHRIISEHLNLSAQLEDQEVTAQEWQLKFEPIAERIQELETEKPETHGAFTVGIVGVCFNLMACAAGSITGPRISPFLLATTLLANLLLLYLFGVLVRRVLNHFNITAEHEAISNQLVELEKSRRFRRLKGKKAS